jgi:hypothetical protein
MDDRQNLIGYCGLYCGDCFGHTQTVASQARDLRKELRQHRFDLIAKMLAKVPFFKEFKDYRACYEVLGAMTKLRCRRVCRGNGGPPTCKIRNCCRKQGIEGCWQCDEFAGCEKLKILEPHHGVAHLKNLRKIAREGTAAFVESKRYWYTTR